MDVSYDPRGGQRATGGILGQSIGSLKSIFWRKAMTGAYYVLLLDRFNAVLMETTSCKEKNTLSSRNAPAH